MVGINISHPRGFLCHFASYLLSCTLVNGLVIQNDQMLHLLALSGGRIGAPLRGHINRRWVAKLLTRSKRLEELRLACKSHPLREKLLPASGQFLDKLGVRGQSRGFQCRHCRWLANFSLVLFCDAVVH